MRNHSNHQKTFSFGDFYSGLPLATGSAGTFNCHSLQTDRHLISGARICFSLFHRHLCRLSSPSPCPSSISETGWRVLVHGDKNRNRATDTDVVVAELLPKSEWRWRATALTEGQGEEKSGEDNGSKALPTGGAVHVELRGLVTTNTYSGRISVTIPICDY